MPDINKQYKLQILFDKNQIAIDELRAKATELIGAIGDTNTIVINDYHNKTIFLELCGAIEFIDNNHDILNTKLINKLNLNFIRVRDELGDEIRCQLYPIMARVEHNLRLFLNRALSEVLGFEWWSKAKFNNSLDFVNNKSKSKKSEETPHHPLECLQLNDLVDMIDMKVCEWSVDKQINIKDIMEIFCTNKSLDEINEYIKGKTSEISYFDNVFKRYFKDASKWNTIKKDMKYILNERHKVMHHRPIRYGVVDVIKIKEANINEIFNGAKTNLTERQIKNINKNTKNIQQLLDQWMLREIPILTDIQRISEDFQKIKSNLQTQFPLVEISKLLNQQFASYAKDNEKMKNIIADRMKAVLPIIEHPKPNN